LKVDIAGKRKMDLYITMAMMGMMLMTTKRLRMLKDLILKWEFMELTRNFIKVKLIQKQTHVSHYIKMGDGKKGFTYIIQHNYKIK
jgi:hypothetical protein